MATATKPTQAPGPHGRPLVGCLFEFRSDPIGLMLRSAREYGDLVQFRIGPVLAHLINHPDYIERVLVSKARHYDKHTRSVAKIQATCGDSLLSTSGETWRRHRQLIQAAFQPEMMSSFVPVIADSTRRMLSRWSAAAASGRCLDLVSEMTRLTLTIATRSLFGADIENDADVVSQSLATILSDTWRRLQSWLDPASLYPALHRQAFKRARQSIDEVVYRMIQKRRSEPTHRNDLLSTLIRARDASQRTGFNDRELRDACVTLLLAGHETTASALAWSGLLISQSPSVGERLRREALTIIPGSTPTMDDAKRLTYASCAFSESIRLYPSIWLMERRVVIEDHIAGCRLPPGSTLLISPYVLHRHPEYWPDPEAFAPERFVLPGRRPRCAYLPFGAGPHQCVGRHLATLVARLVLAMIFRDYRLHPVSIQRCAPLAGITLRHARPVDMRIEAVGTSCAKL